MENEDAIRFVLKTAVRGLDPFVSEVVAEKLPEVGHWSALLAEKDARVGFDSVAVGAGDVAPLLRMLTERLGAHGYLFSSSMPRVAATYASELIAVRNAWAHLREFDDADTYRAIDTAERLLIAVGATTEAGRLVSIKHGLLHRLATGGHPADSLEPTLLKDVLAAPPLDDDESPLLSQPPVDSKSARIEAQDLSSEAEDVEEGVREILAGMTRPLPLAAVSQQVLARFGRESMNVWGGTGGFTALLRRIEPSASVSGPQPGYVHPIGRAVPDDWDREPRESDVPASFRNLRAVDPELPLITWGRMQDTISAVLDAGPIDGQAIAALTKGTIEGKARAAVAIAGERGRLIFKADVIWVLKALTRQHQPEGAVSVTSASQAVATEIASLAREADIDADQLVLDVRDWLSRSSDS
ncbi:Swt1 family HEPN domain-containing protein [Agromyces albus]|uniref:Swt1-like HEPN domain-containing protein n=1 Tax=Agromyces albus TaxID=205332 RepID=A0A4Q2L869_9MICO|nr:Swt1 family HEPN domain-containing protein [Agromyces albus]RXZ72783.1 hypothetical protein ESP51_03005 [Agromyces albus]